MAEEKGVWRTVMGRRIFIADGEDVRTAIRNSNKFSKNVFKTKSGAKSSDLQSKRPLDKRNASEIKSINRRKINSSEKSDPEKSMNGKSWNKPSDEQIRQKAAELVSNGAKHVDRIYNDLMEISKGKIEYDTPLKDEKTGRTLKSTDFKLKTEKSLARKINSDLVEQFKQAGYYDLDGVSNKMYDVVRFTDRCSGEEMAREYEHVVSEMAKKGYKNVRCKNSFFKFNENNPYRGINCVFENEDGLKFELQFHTPESLDIKDKNHLIYEKSRELNTPKEEKMAMALEMFHNSQAIKGINKDVGNIQSFDTLKKKDVKKAIKRQFIRKKKKHPKPGLIE